MFQDWWIDIKNNADFYSKENLRYFVYVMNNFNFETQKPIVFVPCASTKPISKSRTHCYLSAITRNTNLEIIILSEPQTVIPYSLESSCPNYDYPPGNLNIRDRWQLKRRLAIFLHKLKESEPERKNIFYIGSKHHLILLQEANEILKEFTIVFEVPKRGIRDYASSAKEFLEIIKSEIHIKEP